MKANQDQPYPRRDIWIVSQLSEQLEWKHTKEKGSHCHHGQRDHLWIELHIESLTIQKSVTLLVQNYTFSVTNVTASILSIETRPASAIVLFSLILRSSITNVSILRSDCPMCQFIPWSASTTAPTVLAGVMATSMVVFISLF